MEQRLIDFITGLRAGGVRISLAESADAWRAIELLGVQDREHFRQALAATLVKDPADLPVFERLFPVYFGGDGPPSQDLTQEMGGDEQDMLRQALQNLRDRLSDMLERLLRGDRLRPDELRQAGEQAGLENASHPYQQRWFTRRMLQEMGFDKLIQDIERLLAELAQQGMDPVEAQLLAQGISENLEAWREQIANYVGAQIARNQANQQEPRPNMDDLMERPFRSLSEAEAEALRQQVRRLAAHLRARAALRRKRGKKGTLDVKGTLRANLRYGSVPIEMHWKKRHLKPKLCLICDVSTSMRPVVEFMLRLIYELQDQVAQARSFAFIGDMHDISADFDENRPDVAVRLVLERLQPGYYNTNLGRSLDTFSQEHLSAVDGRTTLIFVGDGRNNYNNPRTDLVQMLQRRARHTLWLTPEPEPMWGTGDSDMLAYLPYLDHVAHVQNLADLVRAVDGILTR
ncbi:MAG: VWA domain-containing protein [Caldilineales bacterium]|nr:VWA domain-containing protein [Caldilineales bacterium]MCW5859539.1 VWA domain-containing protein [Caldilineales bacterium]